MHASELSEVLLSGDIKKNVEICCENICEHTFLLHHTILPELIQFCRMTTSLE